MHVYRYPHYGMARPGTNVYERGGHAYGGWSGAGSWGAAATTPTAVAMIPEPRPTSPVPEESLDRLAYASALQDKARQAEANAIAAAATNDPFVFAANRASAEAMAQEAAEVARGGRPGRGVPPDLPATASPRAKEVRAQAIARGGKPGGMGRGIPWEGKTRNEKAATVAVGAGATGAAWWLLAL